MFSNKMLYIPDYVVYENIATIIDYFDNFNIAKVKYKFIFSGIRGDNVKHNKVLFRDNIEDNYTFEMINFFINGYADFLYKKYRKIILSF